MSLLGRRVIVTRAAHQADDLSSALRVLGADVIEVPTIAITDPEDGGIAVSEAFGRIHSYEWLVVTSTNTVDRIAVHLPVDINTAAIGPATARALERRGVAVQLIPPEFVAESLVEVFAAGTGRVLVPRASVARDVLPDGLRAKGWTVDVVTAYETVPVEPTSDQRVHVEKAEVITFTSSSTVENFVGTFGTPGDDVIIACIGPITAATATEAGLQVDVVAVEHTIAGLVAALSEVDFAKSK